MKRFLPLLLVLTVLILPACKKAADGWTEQYELGAKYLTDGNYEAAILAYTAAIDIDPNQPDAYIGRADAYIGAAAQLADGGITPGTEQSQQILQFLQNAEADYRKAGDLISARQKTDTDPDILQAKLDQTAERRGQVEQAEEAAATPPEETWDEAYLAETRPLTDDALRLLDYAALLSALEESGAGDSEWTLSDDDRDGHSELYINTVASHTSQRSTQLFADTDVSYLEAFTHTGAAGNSTFVGITLDTGDHLLWNSGYYTVGYTSINYRLWNGSGWDPFAHLESMPAFDDEGNVTGNDGYAEWNGNDISPEEFYAVESSAVYSATFDNPDLSSHFVDREWRYVLAAIEQQLTEQGNTFEVVTADLDGDGQEEQVWLLPQAAQHWFDHLTYELLWEDECFLGYTDSSTTAIVASAEGTGVRLRTARLGSWDGNAPQVTDTGLNLSGTEYTYHTEGIAFTSGASASGRTLALEYIQLTIPEIWEDQYVVIPVGEYTWNFCSRSDYEQNGNGHVFTVSITEGGYQDRPSYEPFGMLTIVDPDTGEVSNPEVVLFFPTDVQFTEANAEQYWLLNSSFRDVLASMTGWNGAEFWPYRND